jgi:quercetin dioxygenase-like cupin family protein
MIKHSLDALGRELLEQAQRAPADRASRTVVGGHEHVMRQTVLALAAGTSLAEHDNPGEATLVVLRGRIVLRSGADSWDARTGDLLEIPQARHSVEAAEDAVILLTAVPRTA